MYSDALGLPWSLPPPVTFAGPACPPRMSSSTLKERRLRRQNLTPSPRRNHGSATASCSSLASQSEADQLFDGPSRAPRFQHSSPPYERYSFTYISLTLCLSTAFGWLTLKDVLERNNVKSPWER
ncbi:hypothetical protein L210DRAFT_561201 [Boletus edulis BED1]|uniref:Uncharacterized protein n=1 Tax=Boletus edulis BED1 TaxID=1328754 RepID=A0AAD4C944_BOLED|nr:hypothetical protein L210DRAFT_561201 [Boletus edulis BED1]